VHATPREACARRGDAVGLKQSPTQPQTEVGDDQRVPPGSGSGRRERAGWASGGCWAGWAERVVAREQAKKKMRGGNGLLAVVLHAKMGPM
jgi:hypothetical protein